MSREIPQEVLKDALAAAIDSRPLRAAVFTTFSFDPGFFELQVLPSLFDRPFSQAEKICRIQLEEALREVPGGVAVYYDRSALVGDATAAQLDFRRIGVGRKNGCFHPKLVLALVENPLSEEEVDEGSEPEQSLVVAVLSANLTRAGWWENVEVGHVECVDPPESDRDICSFRHDLMSLILQIRRSAAAGEEHEALEQIHQFLKREAPQRKAKQNSVQGRFNTRLFCGQEALDRWLEEIRLFKRSWNLEIISPYFDGRGAPALERLIQAVDPREIRIYLPQDADANPLVSAEQYESAIVLGAKWSRFDESSITLGGSKADQSKKAPRRVHAKSYRFWNRDDGEVVLVGSINLTQAAHSRSSAGNLEAAFLVDRGDIGPRRWWLRPIDETPEEFMTEVEAEEREAEHVLFDLALRFDWARSELDFRLGEDCEDPLIFETQSGNELFRLEGAKAGDWRPCGASASEALAAVIEATSLVVVRSRGEAWRILVREEGMSHKPSLIERLSPEEILHYWSLLSPEQREAFIEEKLAAEAAVEGLTAGHRSRFATADTLFDRFAGIFHAFEQLRRHLSEALDGGRESEALARLCGAKYDSLPVLLDKVIEREDGDLVVDYLTFLCGRQVHDRACAEEPEFVRKYALEVAGLKSRLEKVNSLRLRLLESGAADGDWLAWFEEMFLTPASELESGHP